MSNFIDTSEGENKNFAVTGIKTVNINIGTTETSSDDTETEKYFDNQLTASSFSNSNVARDFNIISDQTFQIIGLNNITFTDPINAVIGDGVTNSACASHTEHYDIPCISKIVIRTTVTGQTNFSVRVK